MSVISPQHISLELETPLNGKQEGIGQNVDEILYIQNYLYF